MSTGPAACWVGVLCLAAFPARAQQAGAPPLEAGVGLMGPTGHVQQTPLRQALVDVPARAQVHGAWVRVEAVAANVWNAQTPMLMRDATTAVHMQDAQLEGVLMDGGVALLPWLSVGARLGMQRLWGGGPVDAMIEEFHRTFDFYNFERELAPVNRTELRVLGGRDKANLHWVGPRPLFPSPLLSVFVTLLQSRTTDMVLRADMQLPLGDVARALHLQAAEVAVGGFIWHRFLNLAALHISGHGLWHGNTHFGGPTPVPQLVGNLSLEIRLLPRVTLLLEDRLASPLFADDVMFRPYGSFTRRATLVNAYFTPVNLITVGARYYLDAGSAMTVHVGEDFMLCMACSGQRFSRENNSPDISLSLSLEQVVPAP